MTSCEWCGAPLFLDRHCPNDPWRLDGTRVGDSFTPEQRRHHGTRLLAQLDAVIESHAKIRDEK